ncbi:hypothetical protein BTM369_03160 [Helicobacter pylori]
MTETNGSGFWVGKTNLVKNFLGQFAENNQKISPKFSNLTKYIKITQKVLFS